MVVYLKGRPYQRGFEHGHLLKKEIKRSITDLLYKGMVTHFKKNMIQHSAALKTLKEHSQLLERYIPLEYITEMKGIADGAEVNYEDILLLHTFLDSLNISVEDWKQFYPHLFFSCSNFIVWGKASADSLLYHGRNLDTPEYGNGHLPKVIFFCQPDEGLPYVSVGWAGICGVFTGMNSAGISLGEDTVFQKDISVRGMPSIFIFRRLLQYSYNLGEAMSALRDLPRTSGGLIALSDGKINRGILVEFTAHHWKLVYPQEDFLIATNHFLSQKLNKFEENDLARNFSFLRWQQLKGLLGSNYGQINAEKIRDFLNDPIVREKNESFYPASDICGMKTLQSVIFLPAQLKFWVAGEKLPVSFRDYLFFDLGKELNLQPLPDRDLNQGIRFFYQRNRELPYQLELIKKDRDFLLYRLSFPSPVKSIFSENNTVRADFYLPKGGKKYPAVIVLPIMGAKNTYLEDIFCRKFVRQSKPFAALLVHPPYTLDRTPKGTKNGSLFLTANTEKSQLNFRQAVIEVRETIDWLSGRPEILPEKIGVMGISLGAEIAGVVLGVEKRVKSGCFILAGGDLANIVFKGSLTNHLVKRINPGLSEESLEKMWWKIDPLSYTYLNLNKEVLMVNGWWDQVIPHQATKKLWQALGRPKIIWLAGGHYSSIFYLFWIGNQVSNFFERSFNEQIE